MKFNLFKMGNPEKWNKKGLKLLEEEKYEKALELLKLADCSTMG